MQLYQRIWKRKNYRWRIYRSTLFASYSLLIKLGSSRIVLRDSIYVLSINREAASYLGVSQEVYDKYLDYIEELNTKTEEE